MTTFLSKDIVDEYKEKSILLKSNKELVKKFHTYKNRATKKGIEFNLTLAHFNDIVISSCYICGTSPKESEYLGIDRVLNSEGYTDYNCKPCCWDCNRLKSNLNEDKFTEWFDRVNPNISSKFKKINKTAKSAKELKLDYKEAENNRINNTNLIANIGKKFIPTFCYIIEVPIGPYKVFTKHFYAMGNLYRFITTEKDSIKIPQTIADQLTKDANVFMCNGQKDFKRGKIYSCDLLYTKYGPIKI